MNASILPSHASFDRVVVDRWSAGGILAEMDAVASEVPVSMEYNGISHAVMLASPSDLEDFAVGFSLSEGIVSHRRQIYDLELTECDEGIQLQIEIASECFALLKTRRRSMAGRTGCGLCGAENLKQVFRPLRPVDAALRLDSQALQTALGQVQAQHGTPG